MERDDFHDFDMLDAMIPSSLKELLNTQIHFRKRVSVEEQRAQKHDRLLRGRQIAYMTDVEGQTSSKEQIKENALWTRVTFHAAANFVKTCHVSSDILPCVRITSLKKDVHVTTTSFADILKTEGKSNTRIKER